MKNYSNITPWKEKDNFLDAKFKITGSPVGKKLTSNSGVPGSTPGLSRELGSHMSGSTWAHVPQLLSFSAVEPVIQDKRSVWLLQLEKAQKPQQRAWAPQGRLSIAKNK